MPKIRFSHSYPKLECDGLLTKYAILLEVFRVKSEELHPRFVEYDTIYWDNTENNWCYYKLPKGDVLVLLFQSTTIDRFLFTTIRRYTPKKYEYYRKMRGKEFEVVIEEKERCIR